MSKARVKIRAVFDSKSASDTAKSLLGMKMVGKDVFREHVFSSREVDDLSGGPLVPTLNAEWRFNNETDRDTIKNFIRTDLQNNSAVKSAHVSWHTCTHNDRIVKDCTTTDYFEWNK